MKNYINKIKMTSLLQMKAQFESLTTQYDDNLAEMATCAARNDEGMCIVLRLLLDVLLPLQLSTHVFAFALPLEIILFVVHKPSQINSA